jgi:hypothetical protein
MENKSTLIEISEEDLNATRILYENKLFPQSIFFFQQSIEKLSKHLGISNEIIEPGKLQSEINHKSLLIFSKLAKRTGELTGDSELNIDNDYQKIINLHKIAPLSELLPIVKNTIEYYKNLPLPKNIEDIVLRVQDFTNRNKGSEKLTETSLNNYNRFKLEEFFRLMPMYICATMTLFMLSPIFSDLVSKIRYPIGDNFINPSKIYNLDHELIIYLPYFIDCQEFNITSIRTFQESTGLI